MGIAHRFSGPGKPFEGLTTMTENGPRWNGKIKLLYENLSIPVRWRKPYRIFVNSMSDTFHEDVPFTFVDAMVDTMDTAFRHTFQVLTKRPERMRAFLERYFVAFDLKQQMPIRSLREWPMPNVWWGTSVEDQERANERIPQLAACRRVGTTFVSFEPLLGPVDIEKWLPKFCAVHQSRTCCGASPPFSWAIIGGESGPKARWMEQTWAYNLIAQCKEAGIRVFMKQVGTKEARIRKYKSYKGEDPAEWPDELRVREFPR